MNSRRGIRTGGSNKFVKLSRLELVFSKLLDKGCRVSRAIAEAREVSTETQSRFRYLVAVNMKYARVTRENIKFATNSPYCGEGEQDVIIKSTL